MKKLLLTALFVSLALLTGCATTESDYALYVESQTKSDIARYEAETARYTAMSAIASTGTDATKVAAVMAIALGNQQSASGQRAPLQAPKSSAETALQWVSVLAPTFMQGYAINANTKVSIAQSTNAMRGLESTNATFLGMAGKIQAPAANVSTNTSTDSHATTSIMSGSGVLGSGTYSTAANPTTTTLSGTGTLGSGAYSTAANPTTNTTTTLSGAGTLGSGAYSTAANPVTTSSDSHNTTTPAVTPVVAPVAP